jgi:hypothetical protein
MTRRYGRWGGMPRGTPEDVTKCIEEVYPRGRSIIPAQCQRKRGHGPCGLFCKQHGVIAQEKLSRRGDVWFSMKYDMLPDTDGDA